MVHPLHCQGVTALHCQAKEEIMSRQDTLQECDHALATLLPALPRPEQKALAALVTGVVSSGTAALGQATAAMPGAARVPSNYRRVQRLLANDRLDVAYAQQCLLTHSMAGWQGRIDLLYDATTTGATAHQAGTVTLCLAGSWRGRALPLAWQTWPAAAPGQDWTAARTRLFQRVRAGLPPTSQVVLLADRGLAGAPLAQAARAQGWHFLLRVQRTTRVQLPDGQVQPIQALAPTPGSRQCVAGVRVWPPRHPVGRRWGSDWSQALVATAIAVWPADAAEPWLLVTDLPAHYSRCREYRHRTREEELFRDLKQFGWQWQRCRLRQPRRVERFLLVLALATLWVLSLARAVIQRGWRTLLEPRTRRHYSCFQLGRQWLLRCQANDRPCHCRLTLGTRIRAPLKLS